jgi:hypothetical protein
MTTRPRRTPRATRTPRPTPVPPVAHEAEVPAPESTQAAQATQVRIHLSANGSAQSISIGEKQLLDCTWFHVWGDAETGSHVVLELLGVDVEIEGTSRDVQEVSEHEADLQAAIGEIVSPAEIARRLERLEAQPVVQPAVVDCVHVWYQSQYQNSQSIVQECGKCGASRQVS